ncbi:MAG: TolC family protein [Alphaproteobacteria bacterium]|nr:TolC family protein [Alphaproteobacteria bacterium]
MKKLIFNSVLAITFSSFSAQAISLEEAIIAAFRNNKGWASSRTEKEKADTVFTQSKAAYLPSLSARITSNRSHLESRALSRDNAGNYNTYDRKTKSTETSMQVDLTQNIFDGFYTTNSMLAAEHSNNAAFHKLKNEEQNLVLNVVNAYTEIWFTRKKLDALKKMVSNLENTLKAQQSSLEAGMSTPTDVAEADSKYQGAKYSMIDAETELMIAKSEFERLTGLEADENISLPNITFEFPESINKLIDNAMKSNSEINNAKQTEQAALKTLSAKQGQLFPSVDVSLSAIKQLSKSQVDGVREYPDSDPKRYSATLSVTIPIFNNNNGNNTYSQIEIANQDALNARYKAKDTELKVKKDCVVNWNKYKSALAMIESSRSAVKSAELSSEGNIEETALGLKSNTDVWAKENNLLEARVNLAKSQKEKIIAAVTLLSLTGELTANSLISIINKTKEKKKKNLNDSEQQSIKIKNNL